MLKMMTSRESTRKVSPPQPTTFSDEQMSDYLSSLRNNRPARPSTGPRPLPPKAASYTAPAGETTPSWGSHKSSLRHLKQESATGLPSVNASAPKDGAISSLRRTNSAMPSPTPLTSLPGVGRPLVHCLQGPSHSVRVNKTSHSTLTPKLRPEGTQYTESGSRWIQKQEALAIKTAMETIDHEDEELRIYTAAQQEAAELVWKHRNPDAGEQERGAAYRYPNGQAKDKHARPEKVAYSRSHSTPSSDMERSASKFKSSISSNFAKEIKRNVNSSRSVPPAIIEVGDLPDAMMELAVSKSTGTQRRNVNSPSAQAQGRSSDKRNTSNGSAKGVFRNPDDQIYEEPEEFNPVVTNAASHSYRAQQPLGVKPHNSLLRGSRPLPERSSTAPPVEGKKVDRFEIYKNPPSQSRNAIYTMNAAAPLPTIDVIIEAVTPPAKDRMEIRSEEIRAATSMQLKDRSLKLPTPTAVSDRPGRPIVSFSPAWQPSEEFPRSSLDLDQQSLRPSAIVPAISPSAPEVPMINIADADSPTVPSINIEDSQADPQPNANKPGDATLPGISISTISTTPTINAPDRPPHRPLPRPSNSSPAKLSPSKGPSRIPWLNSYSRAGLPTATCDNCTLPISGRVVTASGSSMASDYPSSPLQARFHPECFTCHYCSTALECVAFYPEPEGKRRERLERDGLDMTDSSDLRFFCHLDFHEFFSPRCKSCKTPIEGEVIIAAGSEWHVGHFFCGECGDPFSSHTPFVEKDGYAFCVRCHTRRTSARCRACQKQILGETTIEALGAKWHGECFCCWECGGGFGDEGLFFVRQVQVEGTEKEKRRGLKVKVEERAVCESCEQRRLKA